MDIKMEVLRVESEIQYLEDRRFALQMKDHWSHVDYSDDMSLADQLRKCKKELQELLEG